MPRIPINSDGLYDIDAWEKKLPVGFAEIENAREVLVSLLNACVTQAEQYNKTHDTYAAQSYNNVMIKSWRYKLQLCEKNEDWAQLSNRLSRPVEEEIDVIENDLALLRQVNEEFKPWIPDPEAEEEWAEDLLEEADSCGDDLKCPVHDAIKADHRECIANNTPFPSQPIEFPTDEELEEMAAGGTWDPNGYVYNHQDEKDKPIFPTA